MNAFNLTNAIGASGFLLSLVAYCLIRRIIANGATPGRLRCNARICFIVGFMKMGVGIFEIIYFNESGGTWWGWILILFSIFWLLRGNKFRRQARTVSAGYQYFDNNLNENQNEEPQEAPQRRLSNAPQIVVVSSNPSNNASSLQPNSSASIVQGGMAPNALSQPMMSAYDAPIIRKAVPPSPFVCAQGNDSYIVPSIPMANVTTISRISSGPMTPRGTRTIGNVANENDDQYMDDAYDDHNDTQPHAEDSIYIEEDNEDDNDDNKNQENKSNEEEDEDDGKNEIEPETPKGPSERKTSEGNVTFS